MRNKVGTIEVAVEPQYFSSLKQTDAKKYEPEGSDVTDGTEQNNEIVDNDVVEIYLAQALAYGEEREWEKAVAACEEALAIAPHSGNVYKVLGTLYQRQKRAADAMGFYAKALSLQAHFPEVYSNLGSLYAQQKNWEKAIQYYEKAIAQSPQFALAYYNLAKLWQQRGSETAAQKCLLSALKLDPTLGTSQQHYQLAEALAASGDVETAIAFYRSSLTQPQQTRSDRASQVKHQVATYQRLADLLEEQGDWQAATECYHKVLELEAKRSSPTRLLPSSVTAPARPVRKLTQAAVPNLSGLSKADQNRIHRLISASNRKKMILQPAAKAKALLSPARSKTLALQATERQATERQTTERQTTERPSARAQQTGIPPVESQPARRPPTGSRSWPTVIEQLKKAIKAEPKSAVLYRNLAKAFAYNRQKQYAAEAWLRAFMLEPDWPSATQYFELGKVLERDHSLKAAAYCYGHAIRQQPDFRAAQMQLAQLAAKLKNPTNAQANGHTRRTDPQTTRQTAISARYSAAGQKDTQTAQTSRSAPAQTGQTPASAQTPDPARQTQLRQAQRRPRQPRQARRSQQPARGTLSQAQVEAANAAHREGEALRKASDWQAAAEAYRRAIRLYPNFSWSHHSLGDCYKKLENWKAAAEAYRQAISLNDEFVWSYYSLAEVLEAQEEWTAAAESYRRARAIAPDNKQIPPRLASVLRQLIEQSPRNIELYKALAEQLTVQGKAEEAISTYQMALQIEPTEASIALALSKLLSDRDPQQAHLLIDRALAETVNSVDLSETDEAIADAQLSPDAAILRRTHLFDPIYYRAAHPSVANDVSDASDSQALLDHYLTQGSAAGYHPNPLFDDEFYRDRHPDIANQGLNPLVHYYQSGYKTGADPHPFFSTTFYTQTHKDVANTSVNPLEHYLAYGAQEGRAAFSAKQFSALLSASTPEQAAYTQPLRNCAFSGSPDAEQMQVQQHIGVYCSSMGNYFITEIADFIAAALAQAGHQVTRLSEQDTVPDQLNAHWVIAPHEFFYLGEGGGWKQKQDWLARAVMVNVEQPQTTWFSKAFHFLRHAKVIFDINVKSAAILQKLSLPAYWLPLGYLKDYAPFEAIAALPKLRALGSLSPEIAQTLPALSAPLKERPIDLHFIGTLNPRRETFFAQSARWLCKHHSFLHIPPMGVPLLKGQDQALDTETVIGLSRRSKILLNIHRDDLPYFEWHRMIFHGLWQNTLVVTEPCHDIPGLIAGEHFIACELEAMPERLDWLLRSSEGRRVAEQVRSAGHEALKAQFDGASIMANAAQIARSALSEAAPSPSSITTVSGGQPC